MSGTSDSSNIRRGGRRQEMMSTAWDESRASQADRRRLAEVQAAKRRRRGETDDVDPLVGGLTTAGSAGEAGNDRASTPADADHAVAETPAATITPRDDRVHIDPSLVLAREPESELEKNADELSILVVCTGNVCRSPYFECVLSDALRGLPVTVSGAGTGALLIDRMASGSAELLTARGIDPSAFRPRQLQASMVRDADLVLTATREHRRFVVEEAPAQAERVFALLDFADACAALGGAAQGGPDAFRTFVRDAGARTIERRSPRSEEDAAILDPFRQGPEMFERMAAQSDPALATIAGTVRSFLA